MTIRLHNLSLSLDEDESQLAERAAGHLRVPTSEIAHWSVARRAVDARRQRVRLVYSIDVSLREPRLEEGILRANLAVAAEDPEWSRPVPGSEEIRGRVAVVGCGPAGLFAGLTLAGMGYRPLIIERGAPIGERNRHIQAFHAERALDPESNYLFGAGGAGTYSDGKLYTRKRDPRIRRIVDTLIAAGAPESLRIDARPHVGTDLLGGLVDRLCEQLVDLGGEFAWHTKATGLACDGGVLRGVCTTTGTVETNCLVLAMGANGRDTFEAFQAGGLAMEAKPFQMGVRVEHPREVIDRAVYGSHAGHPLLGSADYVLSGCSVTSFCVCPGGVVMSVPVEPETVCTNGMSKQARDGEFTNAALVSTVEPGTFGRGPLAGLDLQRQCERRAYGAAGGGFDAPGQGVTDFLSGRVGPIARPSTYPFDVVPSRLSDVLPPGVADAVAAALREFDGRIPGFAGETGVLIGPETRASCPVRVLRRSDTRVSASLDGVYPAGEGSGYASGIMSSAVDGMRSAEAVIARFAAPRR